MPTRAFLAPLLLSAALASPSAPQTFPDGFQAVPLPGDVNSPVGMAVSPAGRIFVIIQAGRVFVHDGEGYQSSDFIDLRDEVNKKLDRGLLGIALSPGFVPDGGPTSWVYFLYTVSPIPGKDVDYDHNDQFSFSRLTRYRAVPSGDEIVADLASREVLLGNQLPDGSVPDAIASLHSSHSNGSMHFADDGSLLLATGDGAHFDLTDTGGFDAPGFDDWLHPETGLLGPTPADQDSGAFRAQDLRSLAGKIVRINPETGEGYASNPFFDGDLASNASRVWALGLRNPYRVAMIPGTGATDPAAGQPNTLVVGDVGWTLWEELNVCEGGENFGWPCREANTTVASYSSFDPPAPDFPNCNTAQVGTPTPPLVAWNHSNPSAYEPPGTFVDEDGGALPGFFGICAIGGTVYGGGGYPDDYDGRFFFADFGAGWIHTAEVDGDLGLVAVRPFAEGVSTIVALERHAVTGDLYYFVRTDGLLRQIRYTDPDAVQPYGCGVNPDGSLVMTGAGAHIGGAVELELHNPLATQSPGALSALGLSAAPAPGFPCGALQPGFGMAGPLADGELLLSLSPGAFLTPIAGSAWPGTPVGLQVPVPYLLTLVGTRVYLQGALVDPTFGGGAGVGVGLTNALELLIGG
ncbi:MAG: PQQ-dependent sugar dehydrogenase [Planctomycetota bacterium]